MTQSTLGASNSLKIVELAAKTRLPAISTRGEYVILGGLMSYAADDTESIKRDALMLDKVLKGTKPADIPVEQPTKFEFIVNLKTAKQIGLPYMLLTVTAHSVSRIVLKSHSPSILDRFSSLDRASSSPIRLPS